jgi:hypothetical protein
MSHRRSWDNLKRLLMRLCPDFLALTPMAKTIERTWSELSDMAADESAAGVDPEARTNLAAALVKVARLAADRPLPQRILASAFHRGGSIDRRVRSLMSESEASPVSQQRSYLWAWILVAVLLSAPALEPHVLEQVHRVTEAVVHILQ